MDNAGLVISYEEYHPYGTSSYRAFQSSEVSAKRYRYTGKERDEETGLYYHGARYYAAWLGRWTAADPAGTVDGTNLYAYVRGSPIGLSDPSGTQAGAAGLGLAGIEEDPGTVYPTSHRVRTGSTTAENIRPERSGQAGGGESAAVVDPSGGKYKQTGRTPQQLEENIQAANAMERFENPPNPWMEEAEQQVDELAVGQFKSGTRWIKRLRHAATSSGPGSGGSLARFAFGEGVEFVGDVASMPGEVGTEAARSAEDILYGTPEERREATVKVGLGVGAMLLTKGKGPKRRTPKFGQESVRRNFRTSEEGSTFEFAGEPIADVAQGLRSGRISPDQIPVRVVNIEGDLVAVNNRSLLALRRAGLEPTRVIDVSRNRRLETRVRGRLEEMGGQPRETIRVRGAGRGASLIY